MRLVCGLAFTTLLAACQVATPDGPIADGDAELAVGAPEAKSGALGDPAKPKHRVDVTRASWPDAAADQDVVAEMSPAAVSALPSAIVPLLLPSPKGALPELTRNATLMSKPTFVAWSTFTDDRSLTVSLSSSVVVHHHADVRAAAPTSSVRGGKPAWVLQNEGIWSAAWEEFGVWYVVEVECSRPGEDARCKDDTAVRGVVESLRFAGPEVAR